MSLRPLLLASVVALAAAGLSLTSLATTSGPALAEGGHSVVIPANDGYGLAECLADGAPCGRIVADAWCEAQGYGKADTFGPADPAEVTSSIAVKTPPQTAPKAYTVTCRD
jgi:hypothetical protein